MYVAKRAGGSRHVVWSDDLTEGPRAPYTGNDLLAALEQGEVFVPVAGGTGHSAGLAQHVLRQARHDARRRLALPGRG